MAPLYSEDRQGPSRWTPSRAAPPQGPPSMTCLACSMHQRVCSGVSVSTEHSQPVTPWEAKNRPIVRRPSASAAFTSTPAAPWVCRSRKPGSTRNPAASTSGRPFSLWCPRLRAVMRPSSTAMSRGMKAPFHRTEPFFR